MDLYCSLKDYSKKFRVTYRTAYNRFYAGKIPGAYKDESTGHIYVPMAYLSHPVSTTVAIYATCTNKSDKELNDIEEEVRCMKKFCNAKGFEISKIVKEVTHGVLTANRPKFLELLKDPNVKHIVINRKADVCRFGFEYIQAVLETDGRTITVMDSDDEISDRQELMKDVVNVIYTACTALGGTNMTKAKIKKVINKLILNV